MTIIQRSIDKDFTPYMTYHLQSILENFICEFSVERGGRKNAQLSPRS